MLKNPGLYSVTLQNSPPPSLHENVPLMVENCSKLKGLSSFPDHLIPFTELGFAKLAISQVQREELSERQNSTVKCSKRMEIEMCKL